LNVNSEVDERLDPVASTYATPMASWPTALTSYNHGINGMARAQNQMDTDLVRIVEHYNGPAFGFASRTTTPTRWRSSAAA